jgi:Protein of unknown function (DUF3916)
VTRRRNELRPVEKLRGIPRRLRALQTWSESFRDSFPPQQTLVESRTHWNWKLPTHSLMVEGKQSTRAMKQDVAQMLVNACGHLIRAKPTWAANYRATCVVVLPLMFGSELCIYTSESYFEGHTTEGVQPNGVTVTHIRDRSLAAQWSLALPPGVRELGVHVEFGGHENGDDAYSADHWMFGEVALNVGVVGSDTSHSPGALLA